VDTERRQLGDAEQNKFEILDKIEQVKNELKEEIKEDGEDHEHPVTFISSIGASILGGLLLFMILGKPTF